MGQGVRLAETDTFTVIEGELRDGKRYGAWVKLDSAGDTISSYYYHKDYLHGPYQVVRGGQTYAPRRIGVTTYVSSKSKQPSRIEKGTYVKGLKSGLNTTYYQDGSIVTQGNYKKGIKAGTFQHFHDEGGLSLEEHYKKGKLNGLKRWFRSDGGVMSEEVYKKGHLQEETTYSYHQNGKPRQIQRNVFLHGKPVMNGEWTKFYEDGQVHSIAYYSNGKPDNEWIGYYPDGAIKYKMVYKRATFVSYTEFNPDGTPKTQD